MGEEIASPPKRTPAPTGGARESGGSQRHVKQKVIMTNSWQTVQHLAGFNSPFGLGLSFPAEVTYWSARSPSAVGRTARRVYGLTAKFTEFATIQGSGSSRS